MSLREQKKTAKEFFEICLHYRVRDITEIAPVETRDGVLFTSCEHIDLDDPTPLPSDQMAAWYKDSKKISRLYCPLCTKKFVRINKERIRKSFVRGCDPACFYGDQYLAA